MTATREAQGMQHTACSVEAKTVGLRSATGRRSLDFGTAPANFGDLGPLDRTARGAEEAGERADVDVRDDEELALPRATLVELF